MMELAHSLLSSDITQYYPIRSLNFCLLATVLNNLPITHDSSNNHDLFVCSAIILYFDIRQFRETTARCLENLLQIVLINLIHCLLEIIVETLKNIQQTTAQYYSLHHPTGVAWLSVNALVWINVVTLRQTQLVVGRV